MALLPVVITTTYGDLQKTQRHTPATEPAWDFQDMA